jgi:thiosulfate/3-mercaptopyruvate sulfurtransferase
MPLVRRRRGFLSQMQYRFVDCRWALDDPGFGRRAYLEAHIPGAAFLDVERDLASAPGAEGRHPLPSAEQFAAAASRAGIAAETFVVAYGSLGGAERLWWLLRHFGHEAVAVLDGGVATWRDSGGELVPGEEPSAPGDFTPVEREGDTAGAEEIAAGLAGERLTLVDARARERYVGASEPIDPVAGHIPGAANVPFAGLAPGGRYLPPAELRERLERAGASETGEFVAYCGSGVTACTLVLAAELAGLPARLYPGSWSEWCARGGEAETGAR